MHIISLAGLILLFGAAASQAVTEITSGVVEVDLLYPRNETYAPTEFMPIVFAFQNPELAPLIGPSISYTLRDINDMSRDIDRFLFGIDMRWTNFSSNNGSTYYEHLPATVPGLMAEGNYKFQWTFQWANCTVPDRNDGLRGIRPEGSASTWSVWFTIKDGAKSLLDVDSISEVCPSEDQGFAFNVTGTHEVAAGASWSGGDTCGELASSIPKPEPCRTKVSPSAASSISAAIVSSICNSVNDTSQVNCPPKDLESGAPKDPISGLMVLMVLLGALGQALP